MSDISPPTAPESILDCRLAVVAACILPGGVVEDTVRLHDGHIAYLGAHSVGQGCEGIQFMGFRVC